MRLYLLLVMLMAGRVALSRSLLGIALIGLQESGLSLSAAVPKQMFNRGERESQTELEINLCWPDVVHSVSKRCLARPTALAC